MKIMEGAVGEIRKVQQQGPTMKGKKKHKRHQEWNF
jgi:hypothetical protein